MSDPIHLDSRTGYDRWAEIYDTESNPLVALEEPHVRAWLRDPKGLRVADVGCGTGRHAVWLAQAGADVDAFDASSGMMDRARRKLADRGVRFHEHELPASLPVEDETFDVVLFALVADHIADLPAAFGELRRVLKPGGTLIFTVLHPAMNLRGLTARFTDPHTGDEVRVAAFEHTYADYIMAALHAGRTRAESPDATPGFIIEEIIERKVDEALATRAPRAEKYLGWPLLLAMRLTKPE